MTKEQIKNRYILVTKRIGYLEQQKEEDDDKAIDEQLDYLRTVQKRLEGLFVGESEDKSEGV